MVILFAGSTKLKTLRKKTVKFISYSVLNVPFRAEKGRAGFLIWRYLLRRDDPSPAPWEEGAPKYQCIVPDLCKDESTDAENPTKKIKLEMYNLDEEMKKLADADEVFFLFMFYIDHSLPLFVLVESQVF
jgi:hypothetical protein